MELGGIYIPTWLAVVIPLLGYYLRYSTKKFGTFRALGIKGPMPLPVLGTMHKMMRKGLLQHDVEMREQFGDIVGVFQGKEPIMMIYDKDILKQIMVKDFHHFQNRFGVEINDYGLNKMMSLLKDDHWKHVRARVSPTFSSGRLRRMAQLINRCGHVMANNLLGDAKEDTDVELKERCGAYTMDVIASTAFGLDVDSQNNPNNEFVRNAKKSFEFSFTNPRTLAVFFFPFLTKYLGFFPKDTMKFFMNAVTQAMETREAGAEDHKDFLQLMVNAHLTDTDPTVKDVDEGQVIKNDKGQPWSKRGLTHEEVLGQGVLFFIAGYETTANSVTFVLYNLACNPDKQDILIEEIDSIMEGQDDPDYDLLRKMDYLDMVVNETLRIFPPTARVDRVAQADVTINGLYIPNGMVVGISIYAMHHDPESWPEPQKFIPERFSLEEKQKHHPCSFMPFGIGPRNCIAMRLALLELKIAVVQLLRQYRFAVCDKTQIPVKLDTFIVRPKQGMYLKVIKRH